MSHNLRLDPFLIQMSDPVTEMVKVKHPFDKGVAARKGIEYYNNRVKGGRFGESHIECNQG